MAEINGINDIITRGFGLASEGLKPADRVNPRDSFSRLLNDTINRESPAHIVPKDAKIDRTDKLYEQCQELENFLVKNILNAMRKNVMKSSIIDTGYAGEIYEDMLWDEYSKEYTKNAGFGLADLAYLELTGQRGRKV